MGGGASSIIFLLNDFGATPNYENVYLKGYATMVELLVGLSQHFAFYNGERPRQSLVNKTPDEVYRTTTGGSAMILDKFARNSNSNSKN